MTKIKDLPKIERPRERLERYGPEKLLTSELLAILLRTGAKGMNVVELANGIIKKFSSEGIAVASVRELKQTFGLGGAKACECTVIVAKPKRTKGNSKKNEILFGYC